MIAYFAAWLLSLFKDKEEMERLEEVAYVMFHTSYDVLPDEYKKRVEKAIAWD